VITNFSPFFKWYLTNRFHFAVRDSSKYRDLSSETWTLARNLSFEMFFSSLTYQVSRTLVTRYSKSLTLQYAIATQKSPSTVVSWTYCTKTYCTKPSVFIEIRQRKVNGKLFNIYENGIAYALTRCKCLVCIQAVQKILKRQWICDNTKPPFKHSVQSWSQTISHCYCVTQRFNIIYICNLSAPSSTRA
jgi:hypothetical protein